MLAGEVDEPQPVAVKPEHRAIFHKVYLEHILGWAPLTSSGILRICVYIYGP